MTKHVILWTLHERCYGPQLENIKSNIKTNLESLKGQIPGLIDICVYTNPLSTSNADIMLDSTFESPEALKSYAIHPAHVAVADEYVRPYTSSRTCMDYEI